MEPRAESEIACIKIWSRKPSQCIKMVNACIKIWSQCIEVCNACIRIWNRVFSALCDNFRQIFAKKFFGCPPPARIIFTARIINTPADILLRLRILF